ncbi:hypothetical protein MMSR116_16180 [Methylobacterium mesophilicum SR1.6/6]|uniref:Uncharacterized protein n=1 Tax=Methylobacterium mesophilicum SR1.6/6 TaxID=908290 RepID=A0A6B9FKY8_9HYPH|nr:hypothetical protein [Methylobacterium mesophilicum]QGY03250.1 hypothetical protein MMSR116_16180 [Methylobacterium mesophilicum SR1.6/6]
MIEDEFRTVCSYSLVGYEGVETLKILGVEPSPIGPRVRWQAPGMPAERERIVSGAGYVSLGPPSGPMLLDLLSRTLAARWAHGTPRCPANWRDTLRQRFPKLFTEDDPGVGPGWSWLFEAGAVAIRERGVPRNFKTQQTKEKFGSARWYWSAEESCEYTKNVISTLEHLSAFICEDCGRPGRIRRGGWAKCRCDIHASAKSAR